ncbi:hypothetical protein RSK20926_06807 [Roseobacter sp. SK209-2-6]|nr:hypothetical protein RSK20926_06807 [Roseobacter sp. SK209-2-6]
MMTSQLVKHWRALIEASGEGLGPLSKSIGKDSSYLSGVLAGRTKDPGVFTSMALATKLGVSFEFLMGRGDELSLKPDPAYQQEVSKQASRVLTDVMRVARDRLHAASQDPNLLESKDIVSLLLRWWHQQDGKLVGHEQIQDHFDLIHTPSAEDSIVTPYEVGRQSLAAKKLGTTDPDALRRLVETFDKPSQQELVRCYYEVANKGTPTLSPPISVRIPFPAESAEIEVEYFRLQLPVESPNGNRFVLSYCFPA